MEEVNLWKEVGNECLKKALRLLEKDIIPTDETVESARTLVKTAIEIDELNLRWEKWEQEKPMFGI